MDALLRRNVMGGGKAKVIRTLAVNPSSSGGSSTPPSAANAYTDENSTTYANPRLAAGTRYWWFKFDTSALPADANILSVVCRAKARLTGVAGVDPRTIAMYYGSMQKGAAKTLTSGLTTFTFSGVNWTAAELSDARVRCDMTFASGYGNPGWLYFYGATLTIQYTSDSEDGLTR